MLLPKTMVVEQLRARGDVQGAERANRELEEKVDTEGDAELLAGFGLEPGELEQRFGGQSPAVG